MEILSYDYYQIDEYWGIDVEYIDEYNEKQELSLTSDIDFTMDFNEFNKMSDDLKKQQIIIWVGECNDVGRYNNDI